jgi:DHA1 family multidrug resistance protein-like MFS transporter
MTAWKRTFVSTLLAQICSILGFSLAFPFIPYFIRDLGIVGKAEQAYWAGIVLSAAGLSLAVFAPVWGILADRYGRKAMVVRSMVGGIVIMLLMSYVQNVHQLLVCRLLQGMLTGTVTASVALVASVVPPRRGGFALGMMQAGVMVGVCIGPLIGGIVADSMGYRAAFRVGALIIAMGALFAIYGTREDFTRPEPEPGGMGTALRGLLVTEGFLAAVFVLFSVRLSNSIANPSFPLIVKDILGTEVNLNTITGSIIAAAALSGAAAAALLGHFGDRWGHKRILIGCALGGAAASAATFYAHTLPEMYFIRILFGFAVAGMLPAGNAIIHRTIAGHHLGKAYGVATSLSMLGLAVGPYLGGWLGKHHGLRVPFLVTGACQFAVAIVVLLAIRPTPEQVTPTA